MALEIIGFPRSNFVPHGSVWPPMSAASTMTTTPPCPHSNEVKAIHPLGQIPVIRHGDVELAESQAIVRYMEETFDGPRLIPADAAAAAPVNQWMSLVSTSVDRLFMRRYVVQYAFNKDDDGNVIRTEIDQAVKEMPRMFGKLDNAVAPGHIAGPDFTAADCFLMPILAAVQMFPGRQGRLRSER